MSRQSQLGPVVTEYREVDAWLGSEHAPEGTADSPPGFMQNPKPQPPLPSTVSSAIEPRNKQVQSKNEVGSAEQIKGQHFYGVEKQ